jgi:hypothetical protein
MSQIAPNNKTICDRACCMYMLPPMQSHNLLVDFTKMVGPSVGPLLDALTQSPGGISNINLDAELVDGFFTKSLHNFFTDLNKDVLQNTINAFAAVTTVNGAILSKTFDSEFQGELDKMYRWLAWGLDVQWGKSFRALVKDVAGLGALGGPGQAFQSQAT